MKIAVIYNTSVKVTFFKVVETSAKSKEEYQKEIGFGSCDRVLTLIDTDQLFKGSDSHSKQARKGIKQIDILLKGEHKEAVATALTELCRFVSCAIKR